MIITMVCVVALLEEGPLLTKELEELVWEKLKERGYDTNPILVWRFPGIKWQATKSIGKGRRIHVKAREINYMGYEVQLLAEIESDPLFHPIEHVKENSLTKPGALRFLYRDLFRSFSNCVRETRSFLLTRGYNYFDAEKVAVVFCEWFEDKDYVRTTLKDVDLLENLTDSPRLHAT